jgi:hypothetical protein
MRSTTRHVILTPSDELQPAVNKIEEPTYMVSVLKHYRRPPNPKCALAANRESTCYVLFLSTTSMCHTEATFVFGYQGVSCGGRPPCYFIASPCHHVSLHERYGMSASACVDTISIRTLLGPCCVSRSESDWKAWERICLLVIPRSV